MDEVIKLAEIGQFPKKLFICGILHRRLTPRYHFFYCQNKFSNIPTSDIEFKCKICNGKLHQQLGVTTNLSHHLKTHEKFNEWLKYFQRYHKMRETQLDDFTLKLIKFVISSNTSLSQLKNIHFVEMFPPEYNIPSYDEFRFTRLPQIMQKLYHRVNTKLDLAETVCLVVDLWSSPTNADYIAVAAAATNSCQERELLVLGMKPMGKEGHCAESIKLAVVSIINDYKFDKSKINGNYVII